MENIDSSSPNHSAVPDGGFAGTLKNIQLNDLIQMCCLSASSLCMRVTKDQRQGTIFIVDGEIYHAACDDMTGEEAFYRILGWQTGSFESIEVKAIPQRTINKNYNFLIMEAARLADEQQLDDGTAQAAAEPSSGAEEGRLRVLIVDDSPMMRKILSSILISGNQIDVVGMAGNGKEAIALINELSPDLVTLDVNMPVMDGTSTIKHIMIKKPCPVVIMSNPGDGLSKTIFNFLELGAVDFICKPIKNQNIIVQQQRILERIGIAATAKVGNFRIARIPKIGAFQPIDELCRRMVIVIAGPGGHPEQMSLLSVLVPAMADMDGSVVALQSLPPAFSDAFAHYLVERCGVPASPIDHEKPIQAGRCYVGIQGSPLMIKTVGDQPMIDSRVPDDVLGTVDHFLSTAASTFEKQLTIVLLSGADTGDQSGLRAVHERGGRIILRERSSSMVAEPLNRVADNGLADAEVKPADLLETVLSGFDWKP
jgi:two-component system chemotaxis response regulator CheB